MNRIQASLQAVLPLKRKNTSGGWISFNSPCCANRGETRDTKSRGGVLFEHEGFIFHCFNCGFKAGWKPGKKLSKNSKNLFKWFGVSEDDINALSFEAFRNINNTNDTIKELNLTLEEKELPKDTYSFDTWNSHDCQDKNFLNCKQYILDRGLSLTDYNWHWCPEPGYQDRVIIPFYYDKKIVGHTGRKIVAGYPKYLSESQSGYVFNLDAQIYEREFVVVVEGQFDAIAISGCAIMTNEPTEIQCMRINSLGKKVIVVPDRDRAGSKLLKAAIDNNWAMSLPPWDDDIKDVADAVKRYGKIYTLTTILHYHEDNKIKIELQKKKLEKLT